jgi:hypothetical protein
MGRSWPVATAWGRRWRLVTMAWPAQLGQCAWASTHSGHHGTLVDEVGGASMKGYIGVRRARRWRVGLTTVVRHWEGGTREATRQNLLAVDFGGGRRRCLGDLVAPWGQGGGEARRNQGGKWLVVALTDRRRWWRGRLQICCSWWQIPVAARTRGIARSRGEHRGASCGRMARQMGRAMKGALSSLNQGGEDKKENLVTWACDGSVGGSWSDAAPEAQGRGHILSWVTEGTRPSGAHRVVGGSGREEE